MKPSSPAQLAGLQSDTDFIIGSDTLLHEVNDIAFCSTKRFNAEQIMLLQVFGGVKHF